MSDSRIWLIYHKASVSPVSPVNMDGSDVVVGVSIVPSANQNKAILLFYRDLVVNHMVLLELDDIAEFQPEDYQQDTDLHRSIVRAAEGTVRRGLV